MIRQARWAAFFGALAVAAAGAAAPGPREQLQSSVDAVIGVLKDGMLGREERRARITEIIDRRFDFQAMAQNALSTHWKKADAGVRERFVDKFSKLIVSTYIGRIEAYRDERVEYQGQKLKEDRAEVDTAIITGDTDIPIRYKLVRRGDAWLIYDVVIEEVSLIRNYRGSYGDIVKKEGFEGLLAKMDAKIAALLRGEGAGSE